jgi:hypothetical protein
MDLILPGTNCCYLMSSMALDKRGSSMEVDLELSWLIKAVGSSGLSLKKGQVIARAE